MQITTATQPENGSSIWPELDWTITTNLLYIDDLRTADEMRHNSNVFDRIPNALTRVWRIPVPVIKKKKQHLYIHQLCSPHNPLTGRQRMRPQVYYINAYANVVFFRACSTKPSTIKLPAACSFYIENTAHIQYANANYIWQIYLNKRLRINSSPYSNL